MDWSKLFDDLHQFESVVSNILMKLPLELYFQIVSYFSDEEITIINNKFKQVLQNRYINRYANHLPQKKVEYVIPSEKTLIQNHIESKYLDIDIMVRKRNNKIKSKRNKKRNKSCSKQKLNKCKKRYREKQYCYFSDLYDCEFDDLIISSFCNCRSCLRYG